MVFLSESADVLKIRDVPVVTVVILTVIASGFGFLSVQAAANSDQSSMSLFFGCGILAAAGCIAVSRVRICIFDRNKQSATISDFGLFRRSVQHLDLDVGAYAELVIQDEDGEGDCFQATLVADGQPVPLDDMSSSFLPSARVVLALNLWLAKA